MKRGSILSLLFILLVYVSGVLSADDTTLRVESRIIETWDGEDSAYFSDTGEPVRWEVRGSSFSADDRPRTTYAMGEWPLDLFGSKPEDPDSLGVLGINGAFKRQGYNRIELIPGTGSGDDFTARAIPLPGRVQMVDFWVWGSHYNYYVELHFRDFQGMDHVLSPIRKDQKRVPGSIKFVGWKNMYVDMPNYIKLAVNHSKPGIAPLSLSKIVFVTHPAETVSDFYIYLDHFKVFTATHESYYDGFDLTNPQRIDELWGSGE